MANVYKVVRKNKDGELTSLGVTGTKTRLKYIEGEVTTSPKQEAGVWCYKLLRDAKSLSEYVSYGKTREIHEATGIGRCLKQDARYSKDSLQHMVTRYRSITLGKRVA